MILVKSRYLTPFIRYFRFLNIQHETIEKLSILSFPSSRWNRGTRESSFTIGNIDSRFRGNDSLFVIPVLVKDGKRESSVSIDNIDSCWVYPVDSRFRGNDIYGAGMTSLDNFFRDLNTFIWPFRINQDISPL